MRLLIPLLALGCAKAPPDANPDFSDAAIYAFTSFDGDEADLAYAVRALERQVYLSMDVEASAANDRALSPSRLTDADVADLDHPEGADPADAIPVALARLSAYDVADQALIPLLPDQTPVEPYSPHQYDRTFLDGTESCWPDRSCDVLETWNDLIKENLLMTVHYDFYKDFRWVDLALPDPAEVDPPEHEPRWGFVARSWQTDSAAGEGGNTEIVQSYTVELWIPRDGHGFLRTAQDHNEGDGDWTADSSGGGTLRLLALWSETDLGSISFSDDQVAGTTRAGIDDNMKAQESWLDDHVGQ